MALRIEGLDEPIEPVPSDSPTRRRPAGPGAAEASVPAERGGDGSSTPARSERPTGPVQRPVRATGTASRQRRVRPAPKPSATGVAPLSSDDLDASLGTDPHPINTRVAGDLWALVGQRAEDLGVPLRLLMTDALVHALELDPETHATRVRSTRRREQLAKIDAE